MATGGPDRPAVQLLYVDLTEDPETPPQPIHLGFRNGASHLQACLESLEGTCALTRQI